MNVTNYSKENSEHHRNDFTGQFFLRIYILICARSEHGNGTIIIFNSLLLFQKYICMNPGHFNQYYQWPFYYPPNYVPGANPVH